MSRMSPTQSRVIGMLVVISVNCACDRFMIFIQIIPQFSLQQTGIVGLRQDDQPARSYITAFPCRRKRHRFQFPGHLDAPFIIAFVPPIGTPSCQLDNLEFLDILDALKLDLPLESAALQFIAQPPLISS